MEEGEGMRQRAAVAAVVCAMLGPGAPDTAAQAPAAKGRSMSERANGTFEVKVQPLPADEKVAGLKVGRYGFDKTWKGDFEGTSKGEMMSADPGVEGSGAYVAIEQMNGKLKGRQGTFTVVHRGTMQKGAGFDLVVDVVPDSGTGQLAGLAGKVTIVIEGGTHSYAIDYTLPDVR
jgi:hypothetical protein